MAKQSEKTPLMKRIAKKVVGLPDWFMFDFGDNHPVWCFAIAVILSLLFTAVGVAVGVIGIEYGQKVTRRWDGWINAHRTELVPEIRSNFDGCFGSPNADRPFKFCEEPPDWYKSYWVWTNY